jgi:phage terminase small subunit
MATQKADAAQLLAALKPQQRKFVEAFCASFNATQAAKEAGYSEKTARQQGSRLLTIVDIRAAIKAVLDTSAMDPEEVAARWTRLARAGLQDFYTKRRVEYTPRIEKPLAQMVADFRKSVEFEQELAIRSEALITDKKEREQFRKREQRKHLHREQDLLRLEMELEREPNAVRIVDGPRQWRDEMQLDLVKAEELGLLDLVKTHTDGRNGVSFSLRDQDAALDNLAKWRGMLTKHVDLTTGGEKLPTGPTAHDLAKKLSPEQLAQYQAIQEALAS